MRDHLRRLAAPPAGALLLAGMLLGATPGPVAATANAVVPAAVDFGDVPIGGSVSVALTVTVADGWHLLQAAGSGLSAPFGFAWGTCTGNTGPLTCALTESFTPTTLGPAGGAFEVTFCTGACVIEEWEVIGVTVAGTGVAEAAPAVVATDPAAGATRVAPGAHLSVTFSEPVVATLGSFAFGCTLSGQHLLALAGGPLTYVIDPGSDFVDGDGCSLTILGDTIHDVDNADPPDTLATDVEVDFWVSADQAGPVDAAPTVSLRSGVALSGTGVAAVVRWTGSDNPGGSGLARHELARSTDGGSTWTPVTSGAQTAVNVTLATSGTVRFRVRGIDNAGNVGDWAYGPPLAPRLVQQGSSGVRYAGAWTRATGARYSGGSVRYAKASTASATYRVAARSIAFVTTRGPSRGKVRVYVDGTLVVRLDTGRASLRYRDQAWTRTWASAGTHTVRLVVAGTPGRPRVDLDAFAVLLPAP